MTDTIENLLRSFAQAVAPYITTDTDEDFVSEGDVAEHVRDALDYDFDDRFDSAAQNYDFVTGDSFSSYLKEAIEEEEFFITGDDVRDIVADYTTLIEANMTTVVTADNILSVLASALVNTVAAAEAA